MVTGRKQINGGGRERILLQWGISKGCVIFPKARDKWEGKSHLGRKNENLFLCPASLSLLTCPLFSEKSRNLCDPPIIITRCLHYVAGLFLVIYDKRIWIQCNANNVVEGVPHGFSQIKFKPPSLFFLSSLYSFPLRRPTTPINATYLASSHPPPPFSQTPPSSSLARKLTHLLNPFKNKRYDKRGVLRLLAHSTMG